MAEHKEWTDTVPLLYPGLSLLRTCHEHCRVSEQSQGQNLHTARGGLITKRLKNRFYVHTNGYLDKFYEM